VRLRPATREDIEGLIHKPLPWRIRAWAIDRGGEVLGVGGFAYQPNNVIAAFLVKKPGIEKYPVTLHRGGMLAMREARRAGYRRIVATADETTEAAERWLQRFGFEQVTIDDKQVWVWEAPRA
jgi:RimJ/RimL family protein N-acetyltransferase